MKKILSITLIFLFIFFGCSETNNDKVFVARPEGYVEISSKNEKKFIESFKKEQQDSSFCTFDYESIRGMSISDSYGGFLYNFKIEIDGQTHRLSVDDGLIFYDEKFYVSNPFDEFYDCCREVYSSYLKELYYDETVMEYNKENNITYIMYPLEHERCAFINNIKSPEYNFNCFFVAGEINVANILKVFDDEYKSITINKLFNSSKLNKVITINQNYTYKFKRISKYENAFLFYCDGFENIDYWNKFVKKFYN